MSAYELIPLEERVAKCLAILQEQTQWAHEATKDLTRRMRERSKDLLRDSDMKQPVANLIQMNIDLLESIDQTFIDTLKNILVRNYGQDAVDIALEQYRKGV